MSENQSWDQVKVMEELQRQLDELNQEVIRQSRTGTPIEVGIRTIRILHEMDGISRAIEMLRGEE